jgi:hypothetical protein
MNILKAHGGLVKEGKLNFMKICRRLLIQKIQIIILRLV